MIMKLILAISMLFVLASCKTKQKETAKANDSYYTCSMHPQVHEGNPGKCPICGMTLIEVKNNGESMEGGVTLSEQQVQLGNIQVDTIGRGKIGNRSVLNATLTLDETKTMAVSSRIAGRIDRSFFKNTGDNIKKGDRLYDLYSETLNNAKQEYILALEKEKVLDHSIVDFRQIIESARNKLVLWGMNDGQIAELEKTKKASNLTTFYSPLSGTVTAFESHEGEYVAEGGTILRLTDLSTLWAEAQVYTYHLSAIDAKGIARVSIPDIGKEIDGKIELVNPEINPDTRINLVRIAIANKDNLLRPGMNAYVTLDNRVSNALTIPSNAVLRNENYSSVWIRNAHNTYKMIHVTTGKEDGEQVEILSGLHAGDVVVTNGAYLINSEYIFRNGTGKEHDMSHM
jgi:membrane fusion protein, copper/silver efflux system